MRIDGGRDLLALGLIWRLQDGVAQAEGQGQIRERMPRILDEVLVLVRLEAARDHGTIRKKCTCRRAGHSVVIKIGDRWDRPDQVGIGDVVRVGEAAIDRIKPEGRRVRWIPSEPVRIGRGVVIGVCVGGAVLMDESPVPANLDVVLSFRPVEIVDDVAYRHADDGAARLCRRCIDKSEIDIVTAADATLTVSLANVPVANVVDHRWRDRPSIAKRHAFGVVDERIGGALSRKLFQPPRRILLQVAAAKDAMLRGRNPVNAHQGGIEGARIRRCK